MPPFIRVLVVLTVGACASAVGGTMRPPTPPPISVLSADTAVSAGTAILWKLTNASDSVAYYNDCPQSLERRTWRGWRRMYMLPPGGACAALALILRPRTTVRIHTPLPADIPPGIYRTRFLWIDSIPQGRDAPLISHSFRIH